MSKFIKSWILPVFTAILVFVMVRPTLAQVLEGEANLAQYLTNSQILSHIEGEIMEIIYYTLTLIAIISVTCMALLILMLMDCCKIRKSF